MTDIKKRRGDVNRPRIQGFAGSDARGTVYRLRRLTDPGIPVLMDWKIELVAIPVTDVDRAKAFYVEQVGFHADHDHQVNEGLRFVQLTPPGSACSIVLGTGITQMPPGSQKGVQCVVADVEAARQELIAHGVQASDVDVQPWGSFVTFSDPDGNTWALQQLPPRS
jgi:predicted enzyme related to lactoylglutathione lyase